MKIISDWYLNFIYGFSRVRNPSQRCNISSKDLNKNSFDEFKQPEINSRDGILAKLQFDCGIAFPGQVRIRNVYHQRRHMWNYTFWKY